MNMPHFFDTIYIITSFFCCGNYVATSFSFDKSFFVFQVIMATKEGAEKACKEPNPIIDGRKANVNLAILGAKPRVNSLQGKNTTLLFYILSYF